MFQEDDDALEVSITSDEKITPLDDSIEEEQEGFASQPAVVREEIVRVDEKSNSETSVTSSKIDDDIGEVYEDDLYKIVKEHSIQISRLTDLVESLQSQIKKLQETRLSSHKTISAKRNSSNIKTKTNNNNKKKPTAKRTNKSGRNKKTR
jgi:hypothetical protein